MSYGVALRNGVPFTLGTIAALCVNATSQWSPLALWPNGVDSPGMWSSPSTLPASFNDYTGTTPVAVPGTVADSANPVGLALDIRAGATALADPGNHMLQSTSAARPLESAYDGQTLGPGNTYDATGITPFQIYDGTDDGMATATFAAGTLTSGMDCLIAVRRDSAASMIAGLYKSAGDGSKYFGEAWAGLTHTCFAGVGTPTVWVDGTQLAGGTAVNVGTFSNALTVGDWHIVEFRNLDLSAWVSAAFGIFGGAYNFLGARGDIMLFPSPADATERDKARQYLADKYGVTLP